MVLSDLITITAVTIEQAIFLLTILQSVGKMNKDIKLSYDYNK